MFAFEPAEKIYSVTQSIHREYTEFHRVAKLRSNCVHLRFLAEEPRNRGIEEPRNRGIEAPEKTQISRNAAKACPDQSRGRKDSLYVFCLKPTCYIFRTRVTCHSLPRFSGSLLPAPGKPGQAPKFRGCYGLFSVGSFIQLHRASTENALSFTELQNCAQTASICG